MARPRVAHLEHKIPPCLSALAAIPIKGEHHQIG
jgi:hypothetical protein